MFRALWKYSGIVSSTARGAPIGLGARDSPRPTKLQRMNTNEQKNTPAPFRVTLRDGFPKIHKAAGGRDSMERLQTVRFDTSKGRALASNGRILAVVPLGADNYDDCAPSVSVGLPAMVELLKGKAGEARAVSYDIGEDMVSVERGAVSMGAHCAAAAYEFPNVDQLIPDFGECGAPHSVTLNAALLRELVEAIGANKCAIRIEFDKKGGPVLITARPIPSPTGGPFDSVAPPVPGAFGVIMPLTDNGGE